MVTIQVSSEQAKARHCWLQLTQLGLSQLNMQLTTVTFVDVLGLLIALDCRHADLYMLSNTSGPFELRSA